MGGEAAMTTKAQLLEYLVAAGACSVACAWVADSPHDDFENIWNACKRADWMLWLMDRGNVLRYEYDLGAVVEELLGVDSEDMLDDGCVAEHACWYAAHGDGGLAPQEETMLGPSGLDDLARLADELRELVVVPTIPEKQDWPDWAI